MRRFLRHILLFGLPFTGLLAWLLWATPEKQWSYNMIQKDCRTGGWMYRRLYEVAAPVDVAFVGTSKTLCDVQDSLLEGRLLAEHGRRMHIANFGVCRLGENLHWLITRDIFLKKRPRYLIVEVSTEISTNSHFHFPYLARAGDVLGAPLWANSDYVTDLVQLGWNRLVYHRERILGIARRFGDELPDSLHSFLTVAKDVVADSTEMARIKGKRQANTSVTVPEGLKGLKYRAESGPAKHYLRAMVELCKENGAQVVFLYLPVYGTPAKVPQEAAFFESMGPLWVPPDSVFGDARLHFDHSHLNMAGARKLTDWLVERLAQL
jgi:hypothetical protein